MKALSILLIVLMCGCSTTNLVERYTNDIGQKYNVETVEWANKKQWGTFSAWFMTMVIMSIQVIK